VPCVKIQSACFERYLWFGVSVYHELVATARRLGLVVIGDAKRGDIGTSSAHYAAGNLADTAYTDLGQLAGPDALTVNGYLGADALQPFIDTAGAQGKGLFVLVRTSNPGGDAFQRLALTDDRTVCDAMAAMVSEVGAASAKQSQSGYSLVGAVVGATKPEDAVRLRQRMPQQLFLVPGFGAQGGGADDVRACFKPDGTGAIITASRSVIYAHETNDSIDWQQAVETAAIDLRDQIAAILA
jgi:orotidine-5'-phosphate decarboxylase